MNCLADELSFKTEHNRTGQSWRLRKGFIEVLGSAILDAALRERLNKILASDYFTTTPEMKAAVEVVAAAGKYAPCQVHVYDSSVSSPVPVQVEDAYTHYQQEDEDPSNFGGQETGSDQSIPVEELSEDVPEVLNTAEVTSAQQEQKAQEEVTSAQQEQRSQAEMEDQNQRNVESKEQQYIPRRTYQNQRGGRGGGGGGGGGRRGYANGRGGRSGRGGGGFQNGRIQYYEQPGNYYSRNYYNSRGRGHGGYNYNDHGSAADVESGS
ncbi:hypothetical protein NE237_008154 [Protea cynaroides]|uniref:Uncharacterized protein n=1 Tax=Protea cynaroides TaxID=273540 RepID=A0A9Q0QWT4_9MAGN|nr:hypothetical protein NE237_008154 [Protea cynaroides]